MGPFVIFADASSDLPPAYLRENDIRILPMTCLSRGESLTLTGFEDDEELACFYRDMQQGAMYSTSQITPREYEEAFAPLMEAGQDIVYLALSGGLTGTVESADMAARKLNTKWAPAALHVVDTLSASGGINLLIKKAVGFREAGMTAEEAAEKLAALAERVCHVFAVSDLMHLSRGGRISGATAVVGTVLHVLPILIIDGEGKLQVVDRKHGVKAALRDLRQRYEASRDKEEKMVYSAHGNDPEGAEILIQEIQKDYPEAQVEKRILSPVIGAHTGPGLKSLIYFGDREKIRT